VNNRNFLELGYGIELWGSSDNIIIVNNITHNDYGIRLDQSSNNKIYHNNLIGNGQQVDIKTPGYSNSWDDGYPSGGNYWSDYDGVDLYSGRYQNETGGDGIGDKPYIVDADNQDRYPLITHWPPSEHELVTSITGPAFLWLGGSIPLEAIVMNEGVNDEANVELALLINGVIVNSTTIPLLQASDSYTLSYLWTPSVGGTYNITAYASSVPEEESVENNKVTKFVTVGVRPPPPRVGAKAGDWIKYDYTVTGAPSGQALPTWARVEFLSVEGANATMRVTIRWSDGTEQNETMTVDITIGGGPIGTFKGFLIPANCTTGVSIYMSGYGNVTIKGETIRTCAGASRTLVYTSFEQYGTQLTYHWDKQTGVMVEASATVGGMTATAKVAETNMWQPTPFWMQWWLWTIVAVIIVALAGALYLLKKRKPPTPTAPTLPTEGI
jgi:parallel beta-helix repeat protein